MADYAVVVGVARYPQLAVDGVAPDLEGPNNDAQAVHDWLVSPEGGRLDPDNVKTIRSAMFDPLDQDDPQPALARIEQGLKYFSGHGFAPRLEEGALFTAEATLISPAYVFAHSWLRWFRNAQRFREAVLWMDCCMNYQQSIPVNEVVMRSKIGTGVPGPAFVSLAAHTKSALEQVMADGQVHGVFTWTLLKGLEGGASDERAKVTGESLRTFLLTAMPEFLPEEAKRAAAVDLQPFVRADEGMVFRRLPARPKHRVHLRLPAARAGQELKLWTGRPHREVVSDVLTGGEWTGSLVRGLYLAEVGAAGLRQGFQVSGAGDLDLAIERRGPAVVPSDGSELFQLDVVADNTAATIAVTDYRFERVFSDTGELHERDVPGVYKVRIQFGRDIGTVSEEVLLLDRDLSPQPTAPPLPSSAPILDSALTHEYHTKAADRQGTFVELGPRDAAISVMARYWTPPELRKEPLAYPHPMEGLDLLDATGTVVASLSKGCQIYDPAPTDPMAVWEREVPPEVYFLSQALKQGTFQGAVLARPGWVTQVTLRRSAPVGGGAEATPIEDVAVFMGAAGAARVPEQDAVIEAARLALTQGRNLLGEGRGAQLQQLLLAEYADPIAGIIGGHLLLRAMDAEPAREPAREAQFDAAVARLHDLVGYQHPDVAALSLRCSDPAMRVTEPFTAPPMFRNSWELITDATYQWPELLPLGLWQRVHASTSVGPFFAWAADEPTRAAHAGQLAQWVGRYGEGDGRDAPAAVPSSEAATSHPGGGGPGGVEGALPDAVRDDARRLHLPAAAAEGLWRVHLVEWLAGGSASRA